jgi:hypothetical protein
VTKLKGYCEADPLFWKSLPDEREECFRSAILPYGDMWIKRNTFPEYWNDELNHVIRLYNNYKIFGLPFQPWGDCPSWIIEAIRVCDTVLEENKHVRNS